MGVEAGSRAAVIGGVTAVFEMPNTDPTTTTPEALADKVKRAHHRMHCDFAFYIGATRENTRDLAELERLPGACGVKVFMGASTGNLSWKPSFPRSRHTARISDSSMTKEASRPTAGIRMELR